MSHRSLARLDPSTALAFGTALTNVAVDRGVQHAWRAAANDSSAAIEAVATAAGSIATAAGRVSRASAVTAVAWRERGSL